MTVLMTGFPGFLASALLPGILRRSGGEATCLVQLQYADLAARRAEELAAADASLAGRVHLVEGTSPGRAWPRRARSGPRDRGLASRCRVRLGGRARACGSGQRRGIPQRAGRDHTTVPALSDFTISAPAMSAVSLAHAYSKDDLEVGAAFDDFYEETERGAPRRRSTAGGRSAAATICIHPGSSSATARRRDAEVEQAILRRADGGFAEPTIAVLPQGAVLPLTGGFRPSSPSTSCTGLRAGEVSAVCVGMLAGSRRVVEGHSARRRPSRGSACCQSLGRR